MHFNLSRN